MGLLQNGYRHNLTGKLFGGTSLDGANPSVHVYRGHRTAANRNILAGEAITDRLASVPSGNRPSQAWIMARTSGGMSSRNVAGLSIGAFGAGAMGVNIDGSADITFTADATAQLIASAIGSATFTVTASGSALATLNAVGTASFTLTTSGTMGALAWGVGAAGITVNATLTSYAKGFMQGSTIGGGAITNESVAAAVWVSPTRTLTSGGGGGGSAPTAEENANAVWQHAFVGKLLTVAKYLGLK